MERRIDVQKEAKRIAQINSPMERRTEVMKLPPQYHAAVLSKMTKEIRLRMANRQRVA